MAHHLERPDPRDPEVRRLLLEGPPPEQRPGDGFGTSGQSPMTLLPAPEPPVNSLFYDSSQRPDVPLSAKVRGLGADAGRKGRLWRGVCERHGALCGACTAAASGVRPCGPLRDVQCHRPSCRPQELAEFALGPPKAINAAATRLRKGPEAAPPLQPAAELLAAAAAGDEAATAALVAAAAAAGVPFGAPAPAALGGGTVGYGVMGTPALEEVLGTPLMTWGDVASTPLRLGADDMPVPVEEPGPASGPRFAVQGLTEREAAAHRLAAAKSGCGRGGGRGGATPLLAALRRNTGGGVEAQGGGSTPVPLSPAARQLAASLKGGGTPLRKVISARGRHVQGSAWHKAVAREVAGAGAARPASGVRAGPLGSGELDQQLRASYRSAAAAATPSLPGSRPAGVGSSQRPRAAATPAGAGATAGGAAGRGAGAGVTDDLLKL